MSKDVVKIPYEHTKGLAYKARTAISNAAHKVFPGEPIRLVPGESTLLTPRAIADYPHAELYLEAQIRRMFGKLPRFGDNVLFLDIETHNAGKEWGMPVEEFFRLGQYAWGEGPVKLTTDLSEVVDQITRAKRVVAHNGHSFDFSVLIGDLALDLAMQGHLLDTYTFAEVVFPCPVEYIHASGRRFPNNTNPTQYRKWYGLDNLCAQFGFDGKMGNLTELAAQHNPKGTKRADLDFSLIPLDDPDFLAYADQDIVALRELTRSMLAVHPMGDYDERAQKMAAIDAQVMRNGFRVDIELAEKRRDAAQQRTEEIMDQLVRDYNFPTEGKQPWKSAAGKAAIFKALADVGITPKTRPDWTKTATGNPSLSGDTLVALTEGTEAEELGQALAMLGGMRPLAEQVLTYLKGDNRLHCDIDGIQRSGRRSTTKIGLTTFGSRKDTADKAMLLPDEGFELYSADLSGADARAVAFMSGDKNRAKWFEPGADSHEIVGRLMFGDEVYDSDPKRYRVISKACIAEGELVLTNKGLVPIQDVKKCMLLWDGRGWVTHGGVIYQGERDVFTYGGLTATRDHVVYTQAGLEIPFGDAASTHQRIAQTGFGGQPIWYNPDNFSKSFNQTQGEGTVCRSSLRTLWEKWMGYLGQPEAGFNHRLPRVLTQREIPVSGLVSRQTTGCTPPVRESQKTSVRRLRWPWDNVRFSKCPRSCVVGLGEYATCPKGIDTRQNRQQWSLRSGESPVADPQRAKSEQAEHGLDRMGPKVLAFLQKYDHEKTVCRLFTRRNHRTSERDYQNQREPLQPCSRKARVYDIRDAGPHHRFTVSGKLVHNCNHAGSYGAGPRKLAEAAGVPLETAEHYVAVIAREYPDVAKWQNKVRAEGESGWVTNRWGRKMPVQIERIVGNQKYRSKSYTQSPALLGQSSTTEVLYDGLIKLYWTNREAMNNLKAFIHDEVLIQSPIGDPSSAHDLVRCVEQEIDGITFYMECGEPAINWREATH